jgi:hypothetical protein
MLVLKLTLVLAAPLFLGVGLGVVIAYYLADWMSAQAIKFSL